MDSERSLCIIRSTPQSFSQTSSLPLISLYLLWQHDLVAGLVVASVPPTTTSFVVMQLANLEKYKRSAFGRYVNEYMTSGLQLGRIGSFVAMVIGAWCHALWLVLLSLLVILLCWYRRVLLPN